MPKSILSPSQESMNLALQIKQEIIRYIHMKQAVTVHLPTDVSMKRRHCFLVGGVEESLLTPTGDSVPGCPFEGVQSSPLWLLCFLTNSQRPNPKCLTGG